MKKIILTILALVGTMSMNAQVTHVINIKKNGVVVATYKADQADEVEFMEVPVTTGKAYATSPNCDVNWVQLWKDGPKFAEYNVGATSATEYGGYYCWGSSIDKDTYGECKSRADALTGIDDTATNLWGSNWRMPTSAELQALFDNCDVVWTDNYKDSGKKGRIFTGKGDYTDNSVFLPAAGYCVYGYVYEQDRFEYYWSSTPDGIDDAYYLDINLGVDSSGRSNGYSVRAVLNETK